METESLEKRKEKEKKRPLDHSDTKLRNQARNLPSITSKSFQFQISLPSARVLRTFPAVGRMNTDCMSWFLVAIWTSLPPSFFHHFLRGRKHPSSNQRRFTPNTPKFNRKGGPHDLKHLCQQACDDAEAMGPEWWGNCATGRETEGRKAGKANFIHFIILLEAGPIFVSRPGDETL